MPRTKSGAKNRQGSRNPAKDRLLTQRKQRSCPGEPPPGRALQLSRPIFVTELACGIKTISFARPRRRQRGLALEPQFDQKQRSAICELAQAFDVFTPAKQREYVIAPLVQRIDYCLVQALVNRGRIADQLCDQDAYICELIAGYQPRLSSKAASDPAQSLTPKRMRRLTGRRNAIARVKRLRAASVAHDSQLASPSRLSPSAIHWLLSRQSQLEPYLPGCYLFISGTFRGSHYHQGTFTATALAKTIGHLLNERAEIMAVTLQPIDIWHIVYAGKTPSISRGDIQPMLIHEPMVTQTINVPLPGVDIDRKYNISTDWGCQCANLQPSLSRSLIVDRHYTGLLRLIMSQCRQSHDVALVVIEYAFQEMDDKTSKQVMAHQPQQPLPSAECIIL